MLNKNAALQKGISLGKVAEYCGVTRKTILRWVNDGLIKSFALPSGHHRVLPGDLAAFLSSHNMPVPPELAAEDKPKALIVDDEAPMRRLICDILRPHFHVFPAANGIEACLHIGANPPDLLLTDIRMPRMDGLAVCRQIRKDPRLSGVKIVIVSAHLSGEDRNTLRELADVIIAKPFAPKELVGTCIALAGASG